jgi:hypothetical protein
MIPHFILFRMASTPGFNKFDPNFFYRLQTYPRIIITAHIVFDKVRWEAGIGAAIMHTLKLDSPYSLYLTGFLEPLRFLTDSLAVSKRSL